MTKRFYPRDRTFWIYNLSGWSMLMLVNAASLWLFKADILVNAPLVVFLAVAGIHGGLIFRRCLYTFGLINRKAIHLIIVGFLFSLAFGLMFGIITAMFERVILHVYLTEMKAEILQEISLAELFIITLIRNGAQLFMVMSIWCFLYIAFLLQGRSKAAELASARLEYSLKEAQLNSLAGQLNPHFLFNALNNIRFMMRKDIADAEQMLTGLSDILRYSLQGTRKTKVKLEEELDIVNRYLMLVKAQLGSKLKLVQEIAPACANALVPPLVLQMLVENAVKHGLGELKNGGELAIAIAGEKASLRITVINDYSQKTRGILDDGSTGLGLGNITKRLNILYPGKARLKTRATHGKFRVDILLPFEVQT